MNALDDLVAANRRLTGPSGGARLRRIVMRIDPATLARVDAVRRRWPKATRTAVLRAFCLLALTFAEEQTEATPPAR
jgi:hypothetical protein